MKYGESSPGDIVVSGGGVHAVVSSACTSTGVWVWVMRLDGGYETDTKWWPNTECTVVDKYSKDPVGDIVEAHADSIAVELERQLSAQLFAIKPATFKVNVPAEEWDGLAKMLKPQTPASFPETDTKSDDMVDAFAYAKAAMGDTK